MQYLHPQGSKIGAMIGAMNWAGNPVSDRGDRPHGLCLTSPVWSYRLVTRGSE